MHNAPGNQRRVRTFSDQSPSSAVADALGKAEISHLNHKAQRAERKQRCSASAAPLCAVQIDPRRCRVCLA